MRKAALTIGAVCLMGSAACIGFAQDNGQHSGKAGLWEVTTTMTWQRSPSVTGGRNNPPSAGTRTTSVCLTQQMVDAGALLPQSRGQCHLENKVAKPGSLTADYVCTGKMQGKGLLSATLPDSEHVNESLHFEGTLVSGSQFKAVEWTTVSTSVWKSEQCTGSQQAPASPSSPK